MLSIGSSVSHRTFLSLNFFICIKQKSIIDIQKGQPILALLIAECNCEAESDNLFILSFHKDSLEHLPGLGTVLALKL